MNPEPVAGKQIGNLGNRKGNSVALHMHVHFGAGQIERRGVCPRRRRGNHDSQQHA
jgi:hypothetical protein